MEHRNTRMLALSALPRVERETSIELESAIAAGATVSDRIPAIIGQHLNLAAYFSAAYLPKWNLEIA